MNETKQEAWSAVPDHGGNGVWIQSDGETIAVNLPPSTAERICALVNDLAGVVTEIIDGIEGIAGRPLLPDTEAELVEIVRAARAALRALKGGAA